LLSGSYGDKEKLLNLVKGLLEKDFPVPCSLKTRVSTTSTKEPNWSCRWYWYNLCCQSQFPWSGYLPTANWGWIAWV